MHLSQNHTIPGVEIEVKSFDFLKVIQDELKLVEKMRREKYEKVLDNLDNVTFIEAKAKFVGQNEIDAGGQRIQAGKFIIATGSTTTVPPIEGIEKVRFITHIEALKLEKQPKELIIVGAGPLGLEFGQMYSRFGTKVTILTRGDSIFKPGEKEITDRLAQVLTKEGIDIKTNVEVKSVRFEGDKKVVTFFSDGKGGEVPGDEILLASGKTANSKDLDLEKVGVETDKRQAIVVNEFYQSKNPNVYAVGDVTALPLRIETTAGREGTYAAKNALEGTQNRIDYDSVPYTIFTDPQLAAVGLTEDEQMRRMNVCACRTFDFSDLPKAMIMKRTEGLIKMMVDPQTKRILGVHILSPYAGDLIAQAATLIRNKNTTDDVIESFPVFPTLSEAIKIVSLAFYKDISKLSCCI